MREANITGKLNMSKFYNDGVLQAVTFAYLIFCFCYFIVRLW